MDFKTEDVTLLLYLPSLSSASYHNAGLLLLMCLVVSIPYCIQWWQQSTNHTVVGVLGWLIEL